MATKSSTFSSIISGSPMITSEKLEADILEVDRVQWRKINAQLCSVLWQSVDPKILLHLRAYKTCFKFWNQAKGLYTNDIQRLYKVASSIVNVRQQDMDLSTYIGQIASLKEEFLTVMPLTTNVGDQQIQIDKFFMVLTLIGLRPDLETVRDQILGSSSVPSLDDVFAHLLRGRSGNRGRGQRPHCTYCNKLGHTRDQCYQLHGRPPRTAHVAQSSDPRSPQPPSSSTSQGISLTDSKYDDYLRYQATKSASVASVAQTGSASAYLTHTSSLGPWILDSDACDHISGNKDLFSSITTTSALPTVNLANGSQTMAKGFGFAHPLPSLPLHSVLYAPEYRSTGKTIGIGRESQGLYHLTSPSTPALCISTDVSLLIHNRLGHPSLSKFQKMVLVFSSLVVACVLQKGYRYYSSETHRYFLSADVTFFEDSPFFSTSESLLVSEVLPLPIISPPDAVPSRPLQVYHRRHRVVVPASLVEVPTDSLLIPSASPAPALLLLLTYPLLFGKVYGSDYGDTFSPVAKIAYVRLLLSMAAMRSWPLYQLDIKNVFLHGDLAEEVYMEQPPGFVAQGESGLVCKLRRSLYGLKQSPRAWFSRFSSIVQEFGMFRSTAGHSVFYHHNSSGQCIYLVVYVDEIVITSSDQNGIQKLKQHLFIHFQTKDLGKLKYFLGIEIAQSSSGVVLSQRKYALDILEETGTGGAFRRSWEIYATCSHWDVVIRILRYIKSTPGQGVLYENRGHTQVVGYTDADWAGSPIDRRSTFGYCVFIGGNLISRKSKKQDVVARSSAETEYRAMALATCELIWLKHLLRELRFGKDEQMKLICNNQAALHIASNPVFHERTNTLKLTVTSLERRSHQDVWRLVLSIQMIN
ncbi:Retrovirus-related Pol polyprotein from transposon RE2 [Vitis vinifera]|uniref:Retrovirus-related Pol polyprotein from transposon RE2 n=1 Tax=Vitis vinifera TaxID=29760 RepID=A0A438BTZ9_VITVI|nr:Retrovirus-related Pol polyprotein from transposon RE2 [Vitis vinifera]